MADSPRIIPPCRGACRHWWTRYGWVGSSAPTCRHCGIENPKYDKDRDPHAKEEAPRV